MAADEILALIGNYVILSLIIPVVVFIVIYARRKVWRGSYIGRTLMAQKLAIAVMFIFIIAQLFIPDLWGRYEIRIAVFGAIGVTWWLDVFNLHRVRHDGMPVSFYDPTKHRTKLFRRKK